MRYIPNLSDNPQRGMLEHALEFCEVMDAHSRVQAKHILIQDLCTLDYVAALTDCSFEDNVYITLHNMALELLDEYQHLDRHDRPTAD